MNDFRYSHMLQNTTYGRKTTQPAEVQELLGPQRPPYNKPWGIVILTLCFMILLKLIEVCLVIMHAKYQRFVPLGPGSGDFTDKIDRQTGRLTKRQTERWSDCQTDRPNSHMH